jgi:predicted permease
LDVNQTLKQNGRGVTGPSSPYRFRAALIWSEVALAFVLLTGAGLLMRTFAQLRSVDIGCRTKNVLTLTILPSKAHMGQGKLGPYHTEILRRIRAIPEVREAGFTNHIPLMVKGDISELRAEGHDPRETFNCNLRMAGPGYLKAIGIPLRRGRDIDERDPEGPPRVALINETLARKLWPEQDPIGRRIFAGKIELQVVGVTGDIHQSGLEIAPRPEFYLAASQGGPWASSLAIHTSVEPAGVIPAVQRAIWSVDPDQPIIELTTMDEILEREVSGRRLQTALVGAFAGLALILAAVGLYGVLAYLVNQQIPEIGLRMALGAGPGDIARSVVGRGLKLTAIGVALGAAGAQAVSRLMTSLLFGVKPSDPATYVIVAAVLLATAVAATYIPARRAMRVDPMAALREQ